MATGQHMPTVPRPVFLDVTALCAQIQIFMSETDNGGGASLYPIVWIAIVFVPVKAGHKISGFLPAGLLS